MGKKIFLAVCGGIALLGLAIAIIGFAMGGRPGAVYVQEDQLMYKTRNETIAMANAPYWLRGWTGRMVLSLGSWGWPEFDDDADAPIAPTAPSAPGAPGTTGGESVALPFTASQLRKIDIDIAAGYVVVRKGAEPSLSVNGTLPYTSYFEDGEWKIEATRGDLADRIRSNLGRFWLDGEDVTTTFTITLPDDLEKIDLHIDMGEASIRDVQAKKVECSTDLGTVNVDKVSAGEADFEVDLGTIEIKNFSADTCNLDCDMGSIAFDGAVATRLEADCNMGSIYIAMPRPAEYSGNASVSMGSVVIDGQSWHSGLLGGSYNQQNPTGVYFDLECDMGSIEVVFR